MEELAERRRKLLELHYRDQITAEFFAEEERRLGRLLDAAVADQDSTHRAEMLEDDVSQHFAELVKDLRTLDIDRVWAATTFAERRVLVEELVEAVSIFPDYLEVKVAGAPTLNVLLSEVGLKESASSGVGGGT